MLKITYKIWKKIKNHKEQNLLILSLKTETGFFLQMQRNCCETLKITLKNPNLDMTKFTVVWKKIETGLILRMSKNHRKTQKKLKIT